MLVTEHMIAPSLKILWHCLLIITRFEDADDDDGDDNSETTSLRTAIVMLNISSVN